MEKSTIFNECEIVLEVQGLFKRAGREEWTDRLERYLHQEKLVPELAKEDTIRIYNIHQDRWNKIKEVVADWAKPNDFVITRNDYSLVELSPTAYDSCSLEDRQN